MTTRERIKAVLGFKSYDHLPIIHFSYWGETLEKWAKEGSIPMDIWTEFKGDGSPAELKLDRIIGWDQSYGIGHSFYANDLFPPFEEKVVKEFPDGSRHVLNYYGVVELRKSTAGSIPAEIEHTLVDRDSWEKYYKPKLIWSYDRQGETSPETEKLVFDKDRESFLSLGYGSVIGTIRNWIGVVNLSYMMADDPELLEEIVDTFAALQYKVMEENLKKCQNYDSISIWEDICFNYGPLISPRTFEKLCGKHYRKIADLAEKYGIKFRHVDCDGKTDDIVSTWVNNGINVMFPIEVGTWNGSIKTHRFKYGNAALGVGGMDKKVFAYDKAAVDEEIERLKPLVDLGGYIPCPDHRIAPDAKFELVCYYVEQMRKYF